MSLFSQRQGIRPIQKAIQREASFADAKFPLVACSSFTSFLWTKAAENGILVPDSRA